MCVWVRPSGNLCGAEDDPVALAVCIGITFCSGDICRSSDDARAPRNATCRSDKGCDPAAPLVCRATASRGEAPPVCVMAATLGGTCYKELNQSGDPSTHCVGGRMCGQGGGGGPCANSPECLRGECWPGTGALGPTNRAWVGLGAVCTTASVKR